MPSDESIVVVTQELPPRRWTVRDVIDFDRLAARADVADAGDARWFATAPLDRADRRSVFRAWLARARAHAPVALAGRSYARGRIALQALAVLVGVVLGFGVPGLLFARRDAEPVNALLFFGVTVGVQLGVLVLVAFVGLARVFGLRAPAFRAALLAAVGVLGRALDRLDGERRSALRAAWAALDLRSSRLAPLVACEVVITTQLFAIAFNVGLLVSMLAVHLPFEELRFGWQSTYSFTNDGVAAFVRIVSAPWRWSSNALAPDVDAIAATRYVRGQAAATLPADAAHAWWPFLVASIAFYGFLLRSALAAAAWLLLRRRLARLSFATPAANALWRRLAGPLVAAGDGGPTLPGVRARSREHAPCAFDLVVVDADLAGRATAVANACGAVGAVVAVDIDDDRLTDAVREALSARAVRIAVATRAGRDPIVAVASFLRALRREAGDAAALTLMLVGDDARDGAFDAAADARVVVWRRFVGIHRLAIDVVAAKSDDRATAGPHE